ncbi:hypothetical protein H4Q26_000527 [Puccinia striiformis f. sp. tritici PST-130]|nr:hypothetical protein H4Q26_000527 [Puccinia striiformis f. sp. tritici PST-130]
MSQANQLLDPPVSSSASSISPNSSASNQPSSLSPVIVGTSSATTNGSQLGSTRSATAMQTSCSIAGTSGDRLGSDAQGWCDHGRRNAEQARIAEEAGACAVMALERVPSDIRRDGGVARMSDPQMIKEIIDAVTIPVMAKARIGHFVEARILQAIGVDYIDESEVLTPADPEHHINKHSFKVPFVCGAKNLGEALRRILRGEAGTGNVVEAVRHERAVLADIRRASVMSDEELYTFAKELSAPYHLLKEVARTKRLPVVNFAAGGIATRQTQHS